ncbi:MAG: PAS domain S-box protein [Gammaproteobacteria bacterium]
MLEPSLPTDETERLAALHALNVLDTVPEDRFDRITRLAARLFDVPIALVSLVDANRQWFKSCHGLSATETPRSVSFCGHAILSDDTFIIPDALLDARFADNPLVTGAPHVRFYAGQPLTGMDGRKLGTLCIIDHKPRHLSEQDREALRSLAALAQQELNLTHLHQAWALKNTGGTRKDTGDELNNNHDLLNAVSRAQTRFIADTDTSLIFNELLADLLALTNSEYGFIGEVRHTAENLPYLHTYAITNIAWNTETRGFYEKNSADGLEFYNLKTLFGEVLRTQLPVISNNPATDPRRGGLPEGHPALNAFLGAPLYSGGHMAGMVGIANRPGGYNDDVLFYLQPMLNTCANIITAHKNNRQRQEAETALKNSQQQLQAVLDNSTSVIYVKDLQGRYLLINSTYERFTHFDRAYVKGKTDHDLFPKEVADTFRANDLKVADAKSSMTWEEVVPHDDGLHTYLAVKFPLHDATGTLYAICGMSTDITPRIQAEGELRASETRIRAVLDNVLDGIITINEQGTVESFNLAAEQIFGYGPDEVIGKNIKMLMPEPYHDGHDGYLANYMGGGAAKVIGIGREVTGRRKDDSTFPMDLAVSEMRLGERRLFTGIVRDITERKKVDRLKNEFVSTVSHELRTPLTSIRGALGLIAGGVAGEIPAQAKGLVDIAHNNCERLVRLINDILDIEKIESGKMVFDFHPVEIMRLMEEALEANLAYAEQFRVRYTLDGDLSGVKTLADQDRLMQVMANLLSNATKFSPANDVVAVSVARNGRGIRVCVTDHGPGIPEEFHHRIFQKFAQADASDTRQKGGTGLGLNISKAIIEKHGGEIGFKTQSGVGTTFYFDLPEWRELGD